MFYKIPYEILEVVSEAMEKQDLQLIDDTDDPLINPPIYGSIYAELHDKIIEIIEDELKREV